MALQPHYHAVAWIDHHESHVVSFNADVAEEQVIRPLHTTKHFHSRAGSPEGVRHVEDKTYFQEIAKALTDYKRFLVVGPSSAKTEFVAYLGEHGAHLLPHLAAVEAMDKLTEGALVERARKFFKANDRMQPLLG